MRDAKYITEHIIYAGALAAVGVVLTFLTHAAVEPQITHSQEVASSTFTIQQTITAESSFLVEPADVSMVGDINGVTGGQATGTTQFVVQTNNAAGYYVEIDFFDNGTDGAMLGDSSASEALRDYGGDLAEPTFGYTASTAAQFAYTVTSSSTLDTDASFRNDTSSCGGGGFDGDPCWMSPSTTAFRIVERDGSPAVTGATSTVQFNVTVPSGATPVPSAETYTATATLSLFNL